MSQGKKRSYGSFTDVENKEKGNKYFSARQYEKAWTCYTNAILKNPSNPQYYTNRALTGLRLGRFADVVADCRAALDADPTCVKGHFFMGQALSELGNLDDGVKHLQRAIDLAKEQRLNYGDEMTQTLRNWRKRRFSIQEEKRLAEEVELCMYLNRLICEDRDRKLEEIKEKYTSGKGSGTEPEAPEIQDKYKAVEHFADTCMSELNSLFAKLDERRRKREIPDYLCGKISFEILKDPVVTPSGITYERKDIEEHLMRVGHFDPITRVNLTVDQLIPNYAMKEVADAFLSENEWAIDF